MDEWGIFGLSVSTIANLAVAGATLALAFFTYKSVKASQEQVIMNQKEKERPIVLEFINSQLNIILDDLIKEELIIEKNVINWNPDHQIKTQSYEPLVFPMSLEKNFYEMLLARFPFFLYSDKIFRQYTFDITKKMSQRHEIYKIIDQKFKTIHEKFCEPIFNELINTSYSYHNMENCLTFEKSSSDNEYSQIISSNGITEMGDTIQIGILKNVLFEEVKILIVIALFESRDTPDSRLIKRQLYFPEAEAVNHIKEFINRSKNAELLSLKHEIDMQIKELKKVDLKITLGITELKRNLRERYLFTDNEINDFL